MEPWLRFCLLLMQSMPAGAGRRLTQQLIRMKHGLKCKQARVRRAVDDFRFPLMRHWTVYDSIIHSRYVATRLQTWQEKGKDKVKELLVRMGLSQRDCQADYCERHPLSPINSMGSCLDTWQAKGKDQISCLCVWDSAEAATKLYTAVDAPEHHRSPPPLQAPQGDAAWPWLQTWRESCRDKVQKLR